MEYGSGTSLTSSVKIFGEGGGWGEWDRGDGGVDWGDGGVDWGDVGGDGGVDSGDASGDGGADWGDAGGDGGVDLSDAGGDGGADSGDERWSLLVDSSLAIISEGSTAVRMDLRCSSNALFEGKRVWSLVSSSHLGLVFEIGCVV